mgnify:CR=1 FL=1
MNKFSVGHFAKEWFFVNKFSSDKFSVEHFFVYKFSVNKSSKNKPSSYYCSSWQIPVEHFTSHLFRELNFCNISILMYSCEIHFAWNFINEFHSLFVLIIKLDIMISAYISQIHTDAVFKDFFYASAAILSLTAI